MWVFAKVAWQVYGRAEFEFRSSDSLVQGPPSFGLGESGWAGDGGSRV